MRKFVVSVIFALFVSIIMLLVEVFCAAPVLGLLRCGFAGNEAQIVANRLLELFVSDLAPPPRIEDSPSKILMLVQICLSFLSAAVFLIFISRVVKIHLKEEGAYFKGLYIFTFALALFVPEILILCSLFFKFPISVALYIVIAIEVLLFSFTTILTVKVLPDSVENEERKNLFLLPSESE